MWHAVLPARISPLLRLRCSTCVLCVFYPLAGVLTTLIYPPVCSFSLLHGCYVAYSPPSLTRALALAQPRILVLDPAWNAIHVHQPPPLLQPGLCAFLPRAPLLCLMGYATALPYRRSKTHPCTWHRSEATPLWWSYSWPKTPTWTRLTRRRWPLIRIALRVCASWQCIVGGCYKEVL